MRCNLSKLLIIGVFCGLFIFFGLNGSPAGAFSSGPLASRTGAPTLGSFPAETNCTSCHAGVVNSGGGTLTITAPTNYSPNQDVAVTVTINQTGRVFFGFQMTALNDQGQKVGAFVISGDGRTQIVNGSGGFSGREYIEHTFAGIMSTVTGQNIWTFTWKAPAQSAGRVTFYAAGNAANANGANSGDLIYTTNRSIDPASAPLGQFTSVSAASFAPSVSLTPNGIAAGFGSGLSANTVPGTTVPLPTTLDGAEVTVKDANNQTRNAGLFVVSPLQINYLIPADTAIGAATITVRRNGVDTAQGTVNIDTVSPGLFSANANGQGVAAAVILRRRNGVDTFEPVATFNSMANRSDPIPVDLGPATDMVALIAFGSGFRAAPQSAVSATIGGTPSPFVATAAAPNFFGLDQANILIPRSLIGSGLVNVVFTANGKAANPVQISIK